MTGFVVITTIACSGDASDPTNTQIYDRVYKFHQTLADDFKTPTIVLPIPTTPQPNWWDGMVAPFVAHAKPGCKVWKLNGLSDIHQGVADTQNPYRVELGGEKLDVWKVVKPEGEPTTWFIAYPQEYATAKFILVVLSSETTKGV